MLILGLCRVSRVVGYPIIASGTRTQISVRVPERLHYGNNKEVFVKHEQAPTAPKLEGVWFLQISNIFSIKTAIFGQFYNLFLTELVKRHIYGPRPFHLSL